MRWLTFAGVLISLALSASGAHAHRGPAEQLADLDRRLDQHPADANALLERAAQRRVQGQLAEALADLNALYDRDPELPRQWLERGLVFRDFGDAEAARADLELYLQAVPDSLTAVVALAALAEARGDWTGATTLRRRAVRLAPTVATYHAACRLELRRGELDAAASCFEEGLGVLHEAVVLRRALVRVETKRRRYDRALALLDRLVASAALKADAYLDRADVHDEAGHHHAARQDRQRALVAITRAKHRKDTPMRRATKRRALLALGAGATKASDDLSRHDLVDARAALRDGSPRDP